MCDLSCFQRPPGLSLEAVGRLRPSQSDHGERSDSRPGTAMSAARMLPRRRSVPQEEKAMQLDLAPGAGGVASIGDTLPKASQGPGVVQRIQGPLPTTGGRGPDWSRCRHNSNLPLSHLAPGRYTENLRGILAQSGIACLRTTATTPLPLRKNAVLPSRDGKGMTFDVMGFALADIALRPRFPGDRVAPGTRSMTAAPVLHDYYCRATSETVGTTHGLLSPRLGRPRLIHVKLGNTAPLRDGRD